MAKGTRTRIVAVAPIRPSGFRPIPVMLDRERTLSYDLDTAITLGEKLECNCLAGEQFSEMTATKLRTLLWAGLVAEDPGLTEQAVGKIIKMDRIRDIMNALMLAWGIDPDAMAKAAEEAKEAPAQPDPSPPQ